MKKLFLLLSAAVCTAPAFAQTQSVVFTKGLEGPKGTLSNIPISEIKAAKLAESSANKGTATQSSWFDYADLMSINGSSKFYYFNIAPDSNISTTPPYHVYMHGMGMSFDPTDSVYFGGDINLHTKAGYVSNTQFLPDFRVFKDHSYKVDSVRFPLTYERGDNSTLNDSIYVSILQTGDTSTKGIYELTFTASGLSFASAMYDTATSKISDSVDATKIIRLGYKLDAAMIADTNTNGFLNLFLNGIELPNGGMNVPAGRKVIGYVSFVPANKYPLNTPLANANVLHGFAYDLTGNDDAPAQSGNSYQCGLVATDQSRYQDTSSFVYKGHNILIPSVAYSKDHYQSSWDVHVICTSCPPLTVTKFNTNLFASRAYPNPATSEITITFGLKEAANTNVSIMNTVGQVIATQNAGNVTTGKVTFSTANLANGLYFYTVEANGERTTNRFVVAH
ncbi:MAG: hypothetical protein BGO70_06065 [Bacteroidetes bacterium 43-93]|nr:T9SS type A sorting domain-containing protein [Bacteroidota bacterium]OJW97357.1 MAG: hypothetical protein BGO70_06065 [Bacteroidetes bacterium 43-93]